MPREEYPLPRGNRKPSIRASSFPDLSRAGVLPLDNQHPNDCLLGSVDDWDIAVFKHAEYFTVFRLGAFTSQYSRARHVLVFKTFPEAVEEAYDDPRAIVYAATAEECSTPLARHKWGMFNQIWEKDRGQEAKAETHQPR